MRVSFNVVVSWHTVLTLGWRWKNYKLLNARMLIINSHNTQHTIQTKLETVVGCKCWTCAASLVNINELSSILCYMIITKCDVLCKSIKLHVLELSKCFHYRIIWRSNELINVLKEQISTATWNRFDHSCPNQIHLDADIRDVIMMRNPVNF